MKLIFSFFLGSMITLSAQVSESWRVTIPDVLVKNDALLSLRKSLIESGNGAIILDLSGWHNSAIHDNLDSPENLILTQKVWVSSKGKIVYRWKNRGTGTMPPINSILHFNDSYIFSADRISGGRINIYEVIGGELVFKKSDIGATAFMTSSDARNPNVFYGVLGAVNESDRKLTLIQFQTKTKTPSLWIQESDDLQNWQNILELPKANKPNEFFRIAPE